LGIEDVNSDENKILKSKDRTNTDYNNFAAAFKSAKARERNSHLLFEEEEFFTIKVIADLKKVDENYEKSEKAWVVEVRNRAAHLHLKKRLVRNINRSKFLKIKEKLFLSLSSIITINILLKQVLDKKYIMKNLFKVLCKNSTSLELFSHISELQRSVLDVFYSTNLENAVDFHYLVSQTFDLSKIAIEYGEYVKDLTDKPEGPNNMFERFVKEKKRLEEFKLAFEEWKNMKLKALEDLDANLQKKRKMLGVKWEEREMITRIQKITKKRAGLKRQKILSQKKDKIKMKF
jgi:hypothetical protein